MSKTLRGCAIVSLLSSLALVSFACKQDASAGPSGDTPNEDAPDGSAPNGSTPNVCAACASSSECTGGLKCVSGKCTPTVGCSTSDSCGFPSNKNLVCYQGSCGCAAVSPPPGDPDGGQNGDEDGSTPGQVLTITDGTGGNRFPPFACDAITCPTLPSIGKAIVCPLPASLLQALGLNADAGTYDLDISGGTFNNALLVKHPSGEFFFSANIPSFSVSQQGTVPMTTMKRGTDASDTLIIQGTYTCP